MSDNNKITLDRLTKNREEILKAELFMFLHDVGKLQPGHQAKFIKGYGAPQWATKFSHNQHILKHPSFKPLGSSWKISLPPEQTDTFLSKIVEKHHGATEKSDGLWAVLAQRFDRLDSKWDRDSIASKGVQPIREFIPISSPFGWTYWAYRRVTNSNDIECKTKQLPWPLYYAGPEQFDKQGTDCLDKMFSCLIRFVQSLDGASHPRLEVFRRPLRTALHIITTKACGDTRFSVNDITLWDHSISTAILFKSLASWSVLFKPELDNNRDFPISEDEKFTRWFHPQLLPLRIDGLRYLSASNNIPDLLGRRKLLTEIYNALQDILEWEFPLAGEVYRDENGPVFLTFLQDKDREKVINLSELILPESDSNDHVVKRAYLKALQNGEKSLEEYIRQVVIELSHGDLTLLPEISLVNYTQKRTDIQEEKTLDEQEEQTLGELLANEQKEGLWLQADVSVIKDAWDELPKNTKDPEGVCQICGLRPQGYGRWLAIENKDDVKEARREWEKHYAHKHRPNKPYHKKDEKEKNCRVCKAISRKMCGVCLERRAGRARSWAQGIEKSPEERFQNDHPETVWLDEVADKNGRIALIVGYFPLENWLDGTLVATLAMFKRLQSESPPTNRRITIYDENANTVEVVLGPKPVSYSRLRRIWETTRRFWQDVAPTDAPPKELLDSCQQNNLDLENLWEGPLSLEKSLIGQIINKDKKRSRLFLKAKNASELMKDLGPFHAYELKVKNRKVAVLWVPPDGPEVKDIPTEYRGGFWIIENLDYLKKQFEQDFREIVQENEVFEIYEPSEYGRQGELAAHFTIEKKFTDAPPYTPLIPILAEPRTFMAIVPADKAFEVVKAIKAKYEREMGRVRNRLPLHIGVVFAHRKMPLRAIMDAGRRMLEQKWKNMVWEIVPDDGDYGFLSVGKGITTDKYLDENVLENEYKEILKEVSNNGKTLTDQFKKWHRIILRQEVQLNNQQSKKEMFRYAVWYVPAVMGDGSTPDYWYPYVFLAQKDEPKDREIYYKTDMKNPWNPQHPWLVHVSKMKVGDKIYFTPATFDFEFLDFNARRFEIAYDKDGKRKNSLTKPYLLDEIRILEQIWEFVTGKDKPNGKPRLSSTQIFAIRNLIETKREEWFDNPEDSLSDLNFRKFCKDLFINVEWQWSKPDEEQLKWLTEMAVRGYFTDAIYLFHHIMKQGVEETKQ